MNAAVNRTTLLSRIGSYWGEHIHPESESLLLSLLHSRDINDLLPALQRARGSLQGDEWGTRTYWTYEFAESDIEVLGPYLQAREMIRYAGSDGLGFVVIRRPQEYDIYEGHVAMQLESNLGYIAAEDCRYLLWPVLNAITEVVDPLHLLPQYVLKWPFNSIPRALSIGARTLVLGIDFQLGWGAVVFRENPLHLFPEQRVTVVASSERLFNPLTFCLGVDAVSGPVTEISRFFREAVGPNQLERAVAQAAGLVILPQTGKLIEQRDECQGFRYLFDWGSVSVPYNHTPLVDGTTYTAGTIVGEGVKVYGATGGAGWYHSVEWPEDGVPLDDLCPFPGLRVPDRNITFEAYEAVGDTFHVRPWIDGPEALRAQWWGMIKEAELRTGKFLNDILELDTLNQRVYQPALDFFFTHLLADRALVADVRLRSVNGEARRRALAFLREHRIVGTNLIILDR